jgi:hypothetical protein
VLLTLLFPTLTVAMLGAIESLMSAVVADRMIGGAAQLERRTVRARAPGLDGHVRTDGACRSDRCREAGMILAAPFYESGRVIAGK